MNKREQRQEAIERLRGHINHPGYYRSLIEAIVGDDYDELTVEECDERLIDLLTDDDMDEYVKLPVDANGEVIHIGDELTNPHHAGSFTVEAIGGNGSVPHVVYFRCNNGKLGFHYANQCHHYHKPTVEDVLLGFVIALDKRMHLSNGVATTIAEYAPKLQVKDAE